MAGVIGFRVYGERVPRIAQPITLASVDRLELERWVAAHGTPQQVTQRCQIILAAADGHQDQAIAADLQINFKTVALWRGRFRKEGVESLWAVASGRGRKPTYAAAQVAAVIERTLQSKPPGATHWSCRPMAKEQRMSKATVNRIWQSHQIKPHRTASFKLSRDPHFLEKLTAVVGLYLNPPAKALVLCVDEKSQIQALDRTQPGLPLKRGRGGTMPHDYKRNGTTTLFAALELAAGKVVGECYARHRHQEFLEISPAVGRRVSGGSETACRDGQLRHAQTSPRAALAWAASPFHPPFHSDQFQLVESGRTLVWRIDRETDSAWRLRQCG